MKITVAKNSGFCEGVREAIYRISDELNKNDKPYIYGELIHNPQTVSILGRRGLVKIDDLTDIENKPIAIRTHGVPIEEYREIKAKSSRHVNLTCSRVAKVQGIIKKYASKGYFTIILGDPKHAEVKSLKSYAVSGVHIIYSFDDIDSIPEAEKYLVVSQTTFKRDFFFEIEKILQSKFKQIVVFNTICNSTHERQIEVKESIDSGIDTLIVIGGRNSSNTKRLADIGEKKGIKTFNIESEDELSADDFTGREDILVTAGASTPGLIINNVLEKLYNIKYLKKGKILFLVKKCVETLSRLNVIASISGTIFVMLLQFFFNSSQTALTPILSFSGIFTVLTIFDLLSNTENIEKSPIKFHLLNSVKKAALPFVAILSFTTVFITYKINILLSFAILSTLLLSTSLVFLKKYFSRKKMSCIQLSLSSDLFHVLVFVLIITASAYSAIGSFVQTALLISMLSSFFITRSVLRNCLTYEGDLILGYNTLAIVLKKSRRAIFHAIIAAGVISTIFLAILTGKYLLICTSLLFVYNAIIYEVIRRESYLITIKYEIIIDISSAISALLLLSLLIFST